MDKPRNLLTSLVLVSPLFVIYQVGVLFTLPMVNGADFITILLLHELGLSASAYLGFVIGVACLFLVGIRLLGRRQTFNGRMVAPVLLESTLYALTMGSLIVFVMSELLGLTPSLSLGLGSQSLFTRLVMSVGAGLYEELVFRLGLLSGLLWLCQRALGLGRVTALLTAFLVSSLFFSAMHHIPPYGDPLRLGVFTFRVLAGLFFGLLFWFRGLAVAVYTHVLYDVYVLVVR